MPSKGLSLTPADGRQQPPSVSADHPARDASHLVQGPQVSRSELAQAQKDLIREYLERWAILGPGTLVAE